jgi:threonine dehydratase
MRIVAEPGGAAAFSALLSRQYVPARGERVGVLVCGGNTTAVDFGKPGLSGTNVQ